MGERLPLVALAVLAACSREPHNADGPAGEGVNLNTEVTFEVARPAAIPSVVDGELAGNAVWLVTRESVEQRTLDGTLAVRLPLPTASSPVEAYSWRISASVRDGAAPLLVHRDLRMLFTWRNDHWDADPLPPQLAHAADVWRPGDGGTLFVAGTDSAGRAATWSRTSERLGFGPPQYLPRLTAFDWQVGMRGSESGKAQPILAVSFPRYVAVFDGVAWQPLPPMHPEWSDDVEFAFRSTPEYAVTKAAERGVLVMAAGVGPGLLGMEVLGTTERRLTYATFFTPTEARSTRLADALSLMDFDPEHCRALGVQWTRAVERIQVLRLGGRQACATTQDILSTGVY